MAHIVKCKYCGNNFDRDKNAYVMPSARRYAHAECYLREKEKNPKILTLEIFDPTDIVTCSICKKQINKKTDQYKQLSNGKYAHLLCIELEEKREKTDAEKLDLYIMELFDWDYVHPRVKRQISDFIEEYNFTYSGIQKSLEYFYKVKGNSLDKANGGIGIVPYIYQDAYNYYYALWEAKQKNVGIKIRDYVVDVKEISITPPQRHLKKRKLFTFLDEEEEIIE